MECDLKLVEAKLALQKIRPEDLPDLARDLLEAGLDGPGIRRMASLLNPSGWEADQILPAFMTETGLKKISRQEASVRLARDLARRILAEHLDPLSFTRDLLSLWVDSDYSKTLQQAGSLDDRKALADAMGETESELRDYAHRVLSALASERDGDTN